VFACLFVFAAAFAVAVAVGGCKRGCGDRQMTVYKLI